MRFFVILLYLATVVGAANAAQPLAALVPADPILYVAAPNITDFDAHWSATGVARLWQSEEFSSIRTSFYTATRLTATSEQSLVGPTWQQLLEVISGESCFTLLPVSEKKVSFLLLADVSQHADKAKALVDKLRQEFTNAGNTKRFCFLESGVLGISNCEPLAKQVKERLKKPAADNLANSDAYKTIAARTTSAAKSPVQLKWFADPWAFQSLTTGKPQTQETNGLEVVQAAGGAISLTTPQHEAEHHVFIYAPGKREKAARLLDFVPLTDWNLPEWIPADVDSVTVVQWNLAGALPGCGSLFDAAYAEGIEGTFDAIIQDIREEENGPKVDIPELLKLQAGPMLGLAKSLSDGRTAMVYAVKVSDEKKAADALERMFQPDPEVEAKQVGNTTVWVFIKNPKNAGAPALGPDLSGYALAVANQYLYVATSADVLDTFLSKKKAPALVDDKKFKDLKAQALAGKDKQTIGWRAAPQAAGIQSLYVGLRTAGMVDLGRLLGDQPSEDRRLDTSKLPTMDVLPKYIPAAFGLFSQADDGWSLNGYLEKGAK